MLIFYEKDLILSEILREISFINCRTSVKNHKPIKNLAHRA